MNTRNLSLLPALFCTAAFAQQPAEPNWKQIAVIEQQQISAADAQRRQTELEASVKMAAMQTEIDALKAKLAASQKPETGISGKITTGSLK